MNMEYVLEQLKNLLAIDSPSGYTKEVTDYLLNEFEKLGVPAYRTVKGGVIADLGGEDADNAVFVESHVDTLGANGFTDQEQRMSGDFSGGRNRRQLRRR